MKKLMLAMMTMAAASVFGSFSYQGALKLADGTAVTELTKSIEFRLYADATGNNVLWAGQASVLLASGTGVFNTEISDSLQAPSDFQGTRQKLDDVLAANANETLYLGLTVVGSNGEIRPRQKLLAVPTASFAHNVKKASADFTVEGNLHVNGKILSGSENTEVMPVPVGGIIMWSKAEAPNGEDWATSGNTGHWAICNGQNGTPDLRGRFVMGANEASNQNTMWQLYALNTAGGEDKHTLSIDEMPEHSHDVKYGRWHWIKADADTDRQMDLLGGGNSVYKTVSSGGNKAHNNIPPYYALYYIMRVR